jgi:hypothetical protein
MSLLSSDYDIQRRLDQRYTNSVLAWDWNNLFSTFFIREFFTATVVSPTSIKKYLEMKIIISVGHSSLLTVFRVM